MRLSKVNVYTKASPKPFFQGPCAIVFYHRHSKNMPYSFVKGTCVKEIDKIALRRWRKRGFYSENVLVKLLQKNGYSAVRVPVSNPSLNPLPDIMARRGDHSLHLSKTPHTTLTSPSNKLISCLSFLNELVPTEKTTNMQW